MTTAITMRDMLYIKRKNYDKNGRITPKEGEKVCGKAPATVRRYMNMLVGTGCIRLQEAQIM